MKRAVAADLLPPGGLGVRPRADGQAKKGPRVFASAMTLDPRSTLAEPMDRPDYFNRMLWYQVA